MKQSIPVNEREVICKGCGKKTTIMKNGISEYCPDCKRDNFIGLLADGCKAVTPIKTKTNGA